MTLLTYSPLNIKLIYSSLIYLPVKEGSLSLKTSMILFARSILADTWFGLDPTPLQSTPIILGKKNSEARQRRKIDGWQGCSRMSPHVTSRVRARLKFRSGKGRNKSKSSPKYHQHNVLRGSSLRARAPYLSAINLHIFK